MTDLIARLEKATGPSAELFYECAHIAFGPSHNLTDVARWDRFVQLIEAQAWTDAALMLVPSGMTWEVGFSDNRVFWAGIDEHPSYRGATAALAVCIAAMKVRGIS